MIRNQVLTITGGRMIAPVWLVLMYAVILGAGGAYGDTIRFAVIGDRTGTPQPGIYEQIIVEIQRLRPDFAVTVGDMIVGYTDDTVELNSRWMEYKQLIEPLTMPIYFTPGNNDILSEVQERVYREHIGEPYYSFDEDGCHFIILDNGRWQSGEEMPPKQIRWLIEDLNRHSNSRTILVFIHQPFWYHGVAAGRPDTLHSIFVTYGVDAVFTGHFHSYFAGEYDGILYTGVGSSGGGAEENPRGMKYHFCWVTVDGDDIAIAPINMNAVLPWDVFTADQRRLTTRIQNFAYDFEPLLIGGDLKPINGRFSLTIRNYCSHSDVDDTLRWAVPEGWTVTPAVAAVAIGPGQSATLDFTATCQGRLYPVPAAALSMPYAEGDNITVRSDLNAARVVSCFGVAEAPVIDGAVTEAAWHDPVTTFFAPDGGESTLDPTEFFFAHDSGYLYIAARCTERMMNSLAASVAERDGAVYAEDCIGLFLQPDRERPLAFQIYFNPLGYAFDQRLIMNEDGFMDGEPGWNGEYTVATSRGDNVWTIEVAIPLDQFGATGEPGGKWGVNFRRKQKRLAAADWQVPIEYDPRTFGILFME